jgi:hypothetical protein
LPPMPAVLRGAHLPLRRQGAIPIVLQAHQPPGVVRYRRLPAHAQHVRASAVPRRENRGYPGAARVHTPS